MERTCHVIVPTTGTPEVAERVAQVARKFQSDILLESPVFEADAKSLFAILLLSEANGMPLTIKAEGPDAFSAVDALSDLFQKAA